MKYKVLAIVSAGKKKKKKRKEKKRNRENGEKWSESKEGKMS